MASWFDRKCIQDYLCVNFGAISMFYYGVMGVKLKQVTQI